MGSGDASSWTFAGRGVPTPRFAFMLQPRMVDRREGFRLPRQINDRAPTPVSPPQSRTLLPTRLLQAFK